MSTAVPVALIDLACSRVLSLEQSVVDRGVAIRAGNPHCEHAVHVHCSTRQCTFKQARQMARTFPADEDNEHEVKCSWFSQELETNFSPSERLGGTKE